MRASSCRFLSIRAFNESCGQRLITKQCELMSSLAGIASASNLICDRKLTKKEFYCLLLAACGMTSLETAEVLEIAKDTVESHRKKFRQKLNCKNTAHAVFQAICYEVSVL